MQVIGIYPGRFHPFHKGHAASFKQLAQKFGLDNTYLAISAKQEQPKSPFSAQDRAKMAMSLGIPSKNIIAVRNPYAAQEYIDQLNLDPEKTAIVFGVSKKDMEGEPALGIPPDPRFSFKAKRDGSPSYLQPYTKNIKPMDQHGYVMSTDVAEFPIAGKQMRDASAIRSAYAGADNKTKMRILKDLYGDAAEKMKQVFDNNLQVTESIRRLITAIKPLLAEATLEQKAKFVELLSEAKKTMLTEGRENLPPENFNADDINDLMRLRDLDQIKMQAFRLITNPNSSRPIKPEKVSWLKQRLTQLRNKQEVIKLLYDMLLSGEGHKVIGTRYNMEPNVYRKTFRELSEKAGDVYSKGQAAIIDDLGNGYFLGDDSYDDDEGFSKEGYSVYKQEGPDQYRMVGSVNMSPYSNPPGHIENEIKRLISSDQNLAESIDYLEEK